MVERDWFPSLGAATAAGPAATSWVPTEPGFFIFVQPAVWSIPFSGRAARRIVKCAPGAVAVFYFLDVRAHRARLAPTATVLPAEEEGGIAYVRMDGKVRTRYKCHAARII